MFASSSTYGPIDFGAAAPAAAAAAAAAHPIDSSENREAKRQRIALDEICSEVFKNSLILQYEKCHNAIKRYQNHQMKLERQIKEGRAQLETISNQEIDAKITKLIMEKKILESKKEKLNNQNSSVPSNIAEIFRQKLEKANVEKQVQVLIQEIDQLEKNKINFEKVEKLLKKAEKKLERCLQKHATSTSEYQNLNTIISQFKEPNIPGFAFTEAPSSSSSSSSSEYEQRNGLGKRKVVSSK